MHFKIKENNQDKNLKLNLNKKEMILLQLCQAFQKQFSTLHQFFLTFVRKKNQKLIKVILKELDNIEVDMMEQKKKLLLLSS